MLRWKRAFETSGHFHNVEEKRKKKLKNRRQDFELALLHSQHVRPIVWKYRRKKKKKKVGTFPPRHRRKIRFRDAARSRGEIQLTKKKKMRQRRASIFGFWSFSMASAIVVCFVPVMMHHSRGHPACQPSIRSHTQLYISLTKESKRKKKAHSQLISRTLASLRDCGGEFSYFLLFDRKTFSFSKREEWEKKRRIIGTWFGLAPGSITMTRRNVHDKKKSLMWDGPARREEKKWKFAQSDPYILCCWGCSV